jgi:hypothetical protein
MVPLYYSNPSVSDEIGPSWTANWAALFNSTPVYASEERLSHQ